MDKTIESFGKKVDSLVLYILLPCFLISVGPLFFNTSAFWILLIVNTLSWGLVYWLYSTTDTMIIGDVFIHTAGPIRWEIPIKDIEALRLKSKSGINNGTWSLDKMDVVYRESYLKTISIAPLLKEELVDRLKTLNPEIEIS